MRQCLSLYLTGLRGKSSIFTRIQFPHNHHTANSVIVIIALCKEYLSFPTANSANSPFRDIGIHPTVNSVIVIIFLRKAYFLSFPTANSLFRDISIHCDWCILIGSLTASLCGSWDVLYIVQWGPMSLVKR